jgi:hypothetical protein
MKYCAGIPTNVLVSSEVDSVFGGCCLSGMDYRVRLQEMARFLIEVPHEGDKLACAKVVQVFLSAGSHLLSQSDWGCMDGNHSAWIIVDVDSKESALQLIPPVFREQAKIVSLNKFTLEQIDTLMKQHAGS